MLGGMAPRPKLDLSKLDPLLVAAADDVDTGRLAWTASLSPLERLRVATRAGRALEKFRRAAPRAR